MTTVYFSETLKNTIKTKATQPFTEVMTALTTQILLNPPDLHRALYTDLFGEAQYEQVLALEAKNPVWFEKQETQIGLRLPPRTQLRP